MTEPVTTNTERFVRALWLLDRDLAYSRHYPAVSWQGSYSRDIEEIGRWHAGHDDARWAERRAEAARLLDVVNLGGQGGKRVHELSGGMRQRVALARALAQDSAVLLMDEPFAALDAITRDVLHQELTRVWAERRLSVVFVTHNVREAVRLGQRVVLMGSRPGRIVREWAVDISHPRTIESPAVSALAAEITTELHREISRHGH